MESSAASTGNSGGNNNATTTSSDVYVPFGDASSSTPSSSTLQQQPEKPGDSANATKSNANANETTAAAAETTHTYETSFHEKWTTFWSLSIPYFRESGEGRCVFAGLIALMLLDSGVRVAFSYLARDFWSALGDQDADAFYRVMKQFLVALLFLAPINVFYRFQRQRLGIKWRKWMTERILQLYFYNSHQVYYQLERGGTVEKDGAAVDIVDNPDQRIAEDVRAFTRYSLTLFLSIAVSLIDLVAFSIILYLIEPKLFLSIIGFATLGTIITILLGNQLVRLNFERLQREADFRFSLVRLRENAESIAFFRGEETEGKEISSRFDRVVNNAYRIIGTMRDLEFFTATYNYLTWILPVVVIAPQYMAGIVELGVVQQAAGAFGHVLDDLSLIINQFESLSEFSASIGRLHQFILAVQAADPDLDETAPLLGYPPPDSGNNSRRVGKDGLFKTATPDTKECPLNDPFSNESSIIQLQELAPSSALTAATPFALAICSLRLDTPNCRRTLIHSLNLEVKWGERLLIIGSSGIGKSSLLRAIAGLWTSGTGTIQRANTSDVYFLPQKPYCPLGTLRDQLVYPVRTENSEGIQRSNNDIEEHNGIRASVDDKQLLSILEEVDLGDLASRVGQGNDLDGLDTTLDWGSTLSLGEQQRLAFARVLVHKPKLVILDEATSAMDVSAEERMYFLIQSMTVVSVGHRPTLLGYHTKRLHLKKSSGKDYCEWTVEDIRSTPKSVNNDEVNLFFR